MPKYYWIMCPFCMEYHEYYKTVCPKKNMPIPPVYIDDVTNRDIPYVFICTIGYRPHGKTCFLSSFFHLLRRGDMSRVWQPFTYMGLDMEAINKIHNDYAYPLEHGELPPPTPIMFPSPLILKFQKMPSRTIGWKSFFQDSICQRDFIFVFYDIGGETYQVDQRIIENLPILKEISVLVFLIDLPSLMNAAQKGGPTVDEQMRKLLNTIYVAIKQRDQIKKQNLILCFTKADLMWDKEELYGPLSKKLTFYVPPIEDMENYCRRMEVDSEDIKQYLSEKYTPFCNFLYNNFKSFKCVSLSALGSQPVGNKIASLMPLHVFDPILWALKLRKYL